MILLCRVLIFVLRITVRSRLVFQVRMIWIFLGDALLLDLYGRIFF